MKEKKEKEADLTLPILWDTRAGRERQGLLLGDENHRLAPRKLEIQIHTASSILETPMTSSARAGVTKTADWVA